MCPPMKAHWRHLANTIELVHPSTHSSPQPNGKWIVGRFCTAYDNVPIIYNGRPYLPELPFPWVICTSHVTHDALGPCQPTMQMAPRSVQPCFHRLPRSVPILDNGLPVSPSKLPFPMLVSGPHVIRGSLGPPESGTQMATWLFQPFFAGLTSVTDWQSDRQTDRPRYSVRCGIIMRNYVGYDKATQWFRVSTNIFATIKSLSVCLKHLIKYHFLNSYILCR